MTGIETLREIAAEGARVEEATGRLPPHELRFVLEYPGAPDRDAERASLRSLLGTDRLVLEPLFPDGGGELPRYLVLRFPGVERTLPTEALFSAAYDLRAACGARRVEPDLGSRVYIDPTQPEPGGDRPEAAGVFGPLCWVDGEPPPDRRWALASLRVPEAWARFGTRGAGALVGQPDTGVADHAELDPTALDLAIAADVMDGDTDPTDPLTEGTANPGHGTATASVVVSGPEGAITGAAPEARLVPIRCVDDVKVIEGTPVAAAIEHATRVGCDVVTMSLGGLPGIGLHAAVRHAVANGVIVLAAAGNCVGLVVYPARYDEVIAVAGVNAADRPWKGSSRGPTVDVSGPAEFVWRAERTRRSDPSDRVGGGQGTSFAVALTAGVAALWISRHGRGEVRAEAGRRGVTVQELFRGALHATARRPAIWDVERFGAGIVDAEALLALDLGRIPTAATERAGGARRHHVEGLLDEMAGPRRAARGFDWELYGSEVAALLLEDARVGRRGPGSGPEARASWTRPSPQLAERVAVSGDPRLQEIGARKGRRGARICPPSTASSVEAPVALARILGRSRHGSADVDPERASATVRRRLTRGGIRAALDAAERQMGRLEGARGLSDGARGLREAVLGRGEVALTRLARNAATRISPFDRVAIEALIRLTDRPAIRVSDGTIDPVDPELGPWQGAYALGRIEIDALFASVGRIDLDGVHVGTGFVVGPDLVMTNRHVAEAVASPVPTRHAPRRWILDVGPVTIDFSDDADGRNAFRVRSVVRAGPDQITDRRIDFAHLDMALLEVDGAGALPAPLRLAADARAVAARRQLFVVGYPARPETLPTDPDGRLRMDVVARLRSLFGTRFGRKYFSPGEIAAPAAAVGGRGWVFDHDATTLGGNSGSCIGWFDGAGSVLGLHFAGDWLRANHAHALAAVRASDALPEMAALTWT